MFLTDLTVGLRPAPPGRRRDPAFDVRVSIDLFPTARLHLHKLYPTCHAVRLHVVVWTTQLPPIP